jgi:hypothetical protein
VISITGGEETTRYFLQIGNQMPVAFSRAANHSLAKAKTRASAAIVADLGGSISKRAIDRSMFIDKATPRNLAGTLAVGPYLREDGNQPNKQGRIPMFDVKPVAQLPRGVQAGRMFAPRAFLVTMRSGHKAVAGRRRGSGPTGLVGRLPIDERFGPSPLRIFNRRLVNDQAKQLMVDFHARSIHEVSVILRGIVPGAEAA